MAAHLDHLGRRRIVVTGVGAVTPLGVGARRLFDGWTAGESGLENGVGECRDFDPGDYFSRREARRADRFTQLAVAAADEAVADAGWDELPCDPERIGSVLGTGVGGLETIVLAIESIRESGPRNCPPLSVPLMMPNAASGVVGIRHGLRGPSFGVVSACAAGADAITAAARLIRAGEADAVVTGSSEAPLLELAVAGFTVLEALSPSGISRPFDANRDGFVMGEGGGVLVLESLELARERGARILGELRGYGAAADAHHLVAPDPDARGATRALRRALADAGAEPGDIDYINAHGTGTELNDLAETSAIEAVFDEHAAAVPISSLKSSIGHLLGAAGAVEAVATVLALANRVAPPTLNYETPDERLQLDYVPQTARPLPSNNGVAALSNSFGFGGHNTVLCFAHDSASDSNGSQ